MASVMSYSVGNGDMFFIKHKYDECSFIDCSVIEEVKDRVLGSIVSLPKVVNFISTHPDNDHVLGIEKISKYIDRFYCVKNRIDKRDTESLREYMSLRNSDKCVAIKKDDVICNSQIKVLWPDINNSDFKFALVKANEKGTPNDISPIILLNLEGCKFLWLGDMETDFLERIYNYVDWPSEVDILFAPHHGRKSAKVIEEVLRKINPKIVVVGEAPSQYLNYYSNWNTITQNSAGDILFDINSQGDLVIYVSNSNYAKTSLEDLKLSSVLSRGYHSIYYPQNDLYYLGVLRRNNYYFGRIL